MPGKWHTDMENLFPEDMREIKFFCGSKDSNTCRRADILLNTKRTCEIQHSYISSKEIEERFGDWNKFGKDIVWLVDGNTDIYCEQLSCGNYLLEFQKPWKYKSFVSCYDFILLIIDSKVFKIELKKVKCKMIVLKEFKELNEVIELLKSKPENIWNLWKDDNVIKCKLTIHQQGAGNGKTYGIWKSIAENTDKNTYIIVTKQHTAKNVIYEELNDQTKRKLYHIENLTEKEEENGPKHYAIKYTHKESKRECRVVIGTIDSFCCNLASSNIKGSNMFEGILSNIKNNGAGKVTEYGYMSFGGQNIYVNKQCEIWIDEAQDLPNSYLHAMTRLMLDKSCDVHIVGDKLQTLEYEDNFLTSIISEGLPSIELVVLPYKNVNRRIKVRNMHGKINKLIDFSKYDLPEIECNDTRFEHSEQEGIEILDSPAIYANDTDINKVENYVDKIIDKVRKEVDANSYIPEDFMFIFPIMKKNATAPELQTKLNDFWVSQFMKKDYVESIDSVHWKNHNHDEYTEYSIIHKHQEGSSINTNDSIHASRIMSIKASKGDGRNVVFVLDVTERSLKLVSNQEISLVYESHLHVALTRAKHKIYFGLSKNDDNVHKRFGECGYVEYLPEINSKIPLDKIIDSIDKEKLIEIMQYGHQSIEDLLPKDDKSSSKPKEQVDWGYHCIKHGAYFQRVIANIVNNRKCNSDYKKSELKVILDKISKLDIVKKDKKQFWPFLSKYQYKELPHFPLYVSKHRPIYLKYCDRIVEAMEVVQRNIKNDSLDSLTPYESIMLVYMMQLSKNQKFADMNPTDIYNITNFFETDANKEKELLSKIENVDYIVSSALSDIPQNTHWNIFKHIALRGKNEDFKVNKLQFPIIGNSQTDVTHIMLKSDISQLNLWDTMIEVLLERYLIYNPMSDDDVKRYDGKSITTYIFMLNSNDHIKIDWDRDKQLEKTIRGEIRKAMIAHFSDRHREIHKYFIDIKHKRNKDTYWGKDCDASTPYEYISTILKDDEKYPSYIIKFFEELHEKWVGCDKECVKKITSNGESFMEKLQQKLEIACDSYLGLSSVDDEDDDF
jgi:hypothetical protein